MSTSEIKSIETQINELKVKLEEENKKVERETKYLERLNSFLKGYEKQKNSIESDNNLVKEAFEIIQNEGMDSYFEIVEETRNYNTSYYKEWLDEKDLKVEPLTVLKLHRKGKWNVSILRSKEKGIQLQSSDVLHNGQYRYVKIKTILTNLKKEEEIRTKKEKENIEKTKFNNKVFEAVKQKFPTASASLKQIYHHSYMGYGRNTRGEYIDVIELEFPNLNKVILKIVKYEPTNYAIYSTEIHKDNKIVETIDDKINKIADMQSIK
jgi:uncharacterized protein (UPF0254 family)